VVYLTRSFGYLGILGRGPENPVHAIVACIDTFIRAFVVYVMHQVKAVKSTYDESYDVFLHWQYAVAPCFAITMLLFVNIGKAGGDYFLLFFSMFLEIAAILPQLALLQKSGECDNFTALYISLLGAYIPLQLLGFIAYSTVTGNWVEHPIGQYFMDLPQTMIIAIFFRYIFKRNNSVRSKKNDSSPSSALPELESPLMEMSEELCRNDDLESLPLLESKVDSQIQMMV
jgi:ER lumen protein retaining receptor